MDFGVIDCGTNTFNLLVATFDENGKYHVVFTTKIPVKLAPSPTTGLIGKNRFARGVDALYVHKNTLLNLGVEHFEIIATSAIRESGNGPEFVKTVKEKLGLEIKVVSGDEEASLIFDGVKQTLSTDEKPFIIMDIGGGSVEFIIGNGCEKLWQKSLMLGVSRLKGRFQSADKMPENVQKIIRDFLEEEFSEVKEQVRQHGVETLVGSSGSFDTIQNMIDPSRMQRSTDPMIATPIDMEGFSALSKKLLSSSLNERLVMPGMIPMRADMINYAILAIETLMADTSISKMVHSNFALKEGSIFRQARSQGLER